jgi:Ala-tRNA(Pro) deacylase
MSMLAALRRVLAEHDVPFEVLTHSPAYTAQEVAAAQHVPGRDLAKVVVVKAGTRFVMAVLPATQHLDLLKLAGTLPEREARLATEAEFAELFPGCEPGAMPPFGNLFGMRVYVDESLAAEATIVFQAGTHVETVRMAYRDFAEIVRPLVGDFTLLRDATDAP